MLITGSTRLIAHLGYPTASFKAPLIYNPWFEQRGIDAVVVPMGCRAEDYPRFLPLLFKLSNIQGALVTMPHKATTVAVLDEISTAVRIAGSCNVVRLGDHGRLEGDLFDGEGFVLGALRKGHCIAGAHALVVGCGGVGSAIAASLAKAGVEELGLFDTRAANMEGLAQRLACYHPKLSLRIGSNDPTDFSIVVNATPLGMRPGDPVPVDVGRIAPSAFVGEVVMTTEMTPFLAAAQARGCAIQVGLDMLYEQIPSQIEFFGFPSATAEELRVVRRKGE